MKLYCNRPSPYARKVLVFAHEKGLVDRLQLHDADPWSDPPDLLAVTPIGKLPALVTDDGILITESTSICEYLDRLEPSHSLIGPDWTDTTARAALAHGLMDAAFGMVIEARRPAERRWDAWTERQRRAIDRSLGHFAIRDSRFDFGDVVLACALAYMDFRLAQIEWRSARPDLARWLDRVKARPSMQATAPDRP